MKKGTASWTWAFNGLMLWGAGIGLLFWLSLVGLQETIRHKGPGIVHHGDGERGPEWSERVSESQYKRHNYAKSGMMLAIGLVLWYFVAKSARDATVKAQAKEEYLEAQIRALSSYSHAFACAMDDVMRERGAAAARSSAAYQDAKAAQDLLATAYYTACKEAKGDAC